MTTLKILKSVVAVALFSMALVACSADNDALLNETPELELVENSTLESDLSAKNSQINALRKELPFCPASKKFRKLSDTAQRELIQLLPAAQLKSNIRYCKKKGKLFRVKKL